MGMWLFLLALGGADALAQGFDGQRHTPSASSAGGLAVERAIVSSSASAALFASFAWNPVIFRRDGEVISKPLAAIGVIDLMGSVGLVDRLELGVSLPVAPLYQGDDLDRPEFGFAAGPGVGDLRLTPKLVILGKSDGDGLRLGLAVPVRLPSGNEQALRGSGEASVEPAALVGGEVGLFGVHASAGFRIRPGLDAADLVGNEFTYGVALTLSVLEDRAVGLDLALEAFGAVDVDRPGPENTDRPLELLGSLRLRPLPGWAVSLGGGPGLTDGLGTPAARLALGVRFAPEPKGDRDADVPAHRTPRRPLE